MLAANAPNAAQTLLFVDFLGSLFLSQLLCSASGVVVGGRSLS